ncbi:prophage CP4-57 regulatory [Alcanivorax sp. 521-1]|uniref:Prophage CP4-57 regulatory n=2 Tax=Alloalcanivorax profundimaris TaxID=2735259 RepID=A0ABS0AQ72_9GAMM|nr:prophage CP4-57 regulatory [Alloalcanivorax profundimaris]
MPGVYAGPWMVVCTGGQEQMMTMYEFQVHFELPLEQPDSEQWLDALFEAGCDDAIVGLARPGYLSLDFSREGEEAMVVVQSAVGDVQTAIPGAHPQSVGPDLLNLSGIAEWLSDNRIAITRQAMRKYAAGELRRSRSRFPAPRVFDSVPLWHAHDVLAWMEQNGKLVKADQAAVKTMLDLTGVSKAINAAAEFLRLRAGNPVLAEQAWNIMEIQTALRAHSAEG